MSDKNKLKDEELENASGGDLRSRHMYIINATHEWTCPHCAKVTSREIMPEGKKENGIDYLHCPVCDGWYPYDQWQRNMYWG